MNGKIETLKSNTFVLNCYGKPFFPQFYVDGNILHVWVVGYTDQVGEASSYKAELCFYNGGGSNLMATCYDLVKDTKMDKQLLKSGEHGIIYSLKNLNLSWQRHKWI